MSTINLGLEEINTNDTINGTMLQKINDNMQKVDDKYGELKKALLEQTGKETLEEAIAYVQSLADKNNWLSSNGDASASQILQGKSAIVQGQKITGTIPSQGAQTITPSAADQTISAGRYLSGTQTIKGDANLAAENIVSGKTIFGISGTYAPKTQTTINLNNNTPLTAGAAMDNDGRLVIWAMGLSTAYEHVSFINGSSFLGTREHGWGITSFDTGDPVGVPHACTVTGLGGYSTLTIRLQGNGDNSAYDYSQLMVSITGS